MKQRIERLFEPVEHLHLVEKDIIIRAVLDPRLDIIQDRAGIPILPVFPDIQLNRDDM